MKPYVPDSLPLADLDYRMLLPFVGQANAALARYDGLLQGIPNPEVMLSPLTTQEAVLSSKIEGTQATVDEVLEQEAGLLKEGEKYQDIQEISNYRKALFLARGYLKDRSIRLNFVLEMHRVLMDSVRGKNRVRGPFAWTRTGSGKQGAPWSRPVLCRPIHCGSRITCKIGNAIWMGMMWTFFCRQRSCTPSLSCFIPLRTGTDASGVS